MAHSQNQTYSNWNKNNPMTITLLWAFLTNKLQLNNY